MIQTETRLRVADNSGAKNFYVSVSSAEQAVSTRTLVISSFVLLKKQHQAASLKKVTLSRL